MLLGAFEEDFRKGCSLYKEGKYKEALAVFEGLLKGVKGKERVGVLANAASAAYALADYKKAASYLEEATKLAPDDAKLRLGLVRALALCGRRNEALKHLAKTKFAEDTAEFWKSAALASANTPSEVVALRLLVAVGVADTQVRERLVGLLLRQGRYEEAYAEAWSWVRAESQNGRAWFYLGICALRKGDEEEGKEACYVALALGEEKARGVLASLLERRGELVSAVLVLAGSSRIEEKKRAAELALKAGEAQLALQALKDVGKEGDGLRSLALLKAGHRKRALKLAKEVLNTNPDDHYAKEVLEELEPKK